MKKLESLKKNSHFEIVLKNRVVNNNLFSIYCAKNFIKKNDNDNKLYIVFGKTKVYAENSEDLFKKMKSSFKCIKG